MTAPFRFDTTRTVNLTLPGGTHTFAMTYASDGVPIVAVFVGDRLHEAAFTMIRPDVATAMGALLATHADLVTKVAWAVEQMRQRPVKDDMADHLATAIGLEA